MNSPHKKTKILLIVSFIIIFVVLFSICNLITFAAENIVADDKSFDVIFVIDCSGSMNDNDPNKSLSKNK